MTKTEELVQLIPKTCPDLDQHYKKINVTQFTKNLGTLIFDVNIDQRAIDQFKDYKILKLSDYLDIYKEKWFKDQKYFDSELENDKKGNSDLENSKSEELTNQFLSPFEVSAIVSSTKSVLPFHKILPSTLDFVYPFIYGHVSTITEEQDGLWIDELLDRIEKCDRVHSEILDDENLQNEKNSTEGESTEQNLRNSAIEQIKSANDPTGSLYPSTKTHLQLLSTIQEKTSLRGLQKYMQHAKKCAMSLGGKELRFFAVEESKTPKKTNKKTSKKDSIILENEKRMEKIKIEKDKQFLKSFLAKYLRSTDIQKKYFLEGIQIDTYSFLIRKRITLLRIEFYNNVWKYEARKERPDDSKMVDLYVNCLYFIQEIALNEENTSSPVTAQEKEYVYTIMKEIGFTATLEELDAQFEEASDSKENSWAVSDLDIYFQLKHAGDRLKRSLNSVKDPRSSFLLDAWQKKTLDLIDQEKSLIISAPTSSGKTFITYYAINKTRGNISLQENEKKKQTEIKQRKRVLFVVPEKALVNQLKFDIINKFESLKYGMILKEFSYDDDADIILSVPEMIEGILEKWERIDAQEAENMKNSAKNKNKRTDNGVTLIIDEIHKLNSPEMSSFIERSIHKHTGQLICLSATMGEDKKIYHWLKDLRGDMELVEHEERYCELRKHYWTGAEDKKMGLISPLIHLTADDFYSAVSEGETDKSENKITSKSDKNKTENDAIYELAHPKDIPYPLKSITLLPEDVLALYYAIFSVATQGSCSNEKQLKKEVKKLKFSKWFKSNILTKMDVKLYYFDLIRVVIRNKIAAEVLEIMNKPTMNMFGHIAPQIDTEKNTAINKDLEPRKIYCNSNINDIVNLINHLQENDLLPVIVFGMSREQLTTLSYKLYEHIYQKQTVNERVDTKREEKLREIKKFSERKTSGKDDWKEESLLVDELESVVHLREDYSIEKISSNEIDDLVSDLHVNQIYKSMLHYGIGVHHRGLHKKYRESVEIMFRRKNLGVVFSSETLSLGINMPCRSVVICGENGDLKRGDDEKGENIKSEKKTNSKYLTSLDKISLVQMSGRAGRRGHDTIGNVIYLGISPENLIRLTRASESIEKPYSLDVYSALWFDKNYLKNLLTHPFTSISDSTQNEEEIREFTELYGEFTQKILAAHQKSCLGPGQSALNSISLTELFDLLKTSQIRNQYLNLLSLLFEYGFILPCAIEKKSKDETDPLSAITFTRSTWGDILISNEVADPFLFLILIRKGLVPFADLKHRGFVNLISHFIGVKTFDILSHVQTKETQNGSNFFDLSSSLLLDPLPKQIQTFLQSISEKYPLNSPEIKLTSFLSVNKQIKSNYIYDFYCNGYGSFLKKYGNNRTEDTSKDKISLFISESELWKSVSSMHQLLESLIDVLEGDQKKLVRDVWDMMELKLKGIAA